MTEIDPGNNMIIDDRETNTLEQTLIGTIMTATVRTRICTAIVVTEIRQNNFTEAGKEAGKKD